MHTRKLVSFSMLIGLVFFPFGDTAAIQNTSPMMLPPPSTTFGWEFDGNQNQAFFGQSWSPAGDVNGDGFDDMIVGVRGFDTPAVDAGRAMVFYGSLTGYNASTPDWVVNGENAVDNYGVSVSAAGDVNGDGYDDVLVGAYGFDLASPVTSAVGKVYLYYGSATGLSLTPAWTATGNQESQFFGYRVAGVGDVNGDGHDDIAVGSHGYDGGEVDEGRVYVFHGTATIPASTADWTAESNQAGLRFGLSVSGIGDVNGDGYDDLIMGAENGTTYESAAFAWFGSATGLGASGTPANADWMAESDQTTRFFAEMLGTPGDVNGDGFDEVVISSREYDKGQTDEGVLFLWYGSASGINLGVNGTPANADWWAESNATGYGFGTVTGTPADINGDGFDDVIVGCLLETPGIYAYFGSASGPNLGVTGDRSNADWQVSQPSISGLSNAYFGWQAGSPGDANGDGIDDVAVNALYYHNGVLNTDPSYREGKMWAYYSNAGVITGTVTYAGPIATTHQIFVSAHLNPAGIPVASDVVFSGENYKINSLDDGSYYIGAFLDANDTGGGPPDPGEPMAWYDPDHDGLPEPLVISSGSDFTGIDLVIADWTVYLPLIRR